MLPRLFVLTILLCFNVLLTGCGGPLWAAEGSSSPGSSHGHAGRQAAARWTTLSSFHGWAGRQEVDHPRMVQAQSGPLRESAPLKLPPFASLGTWSRRKNYLPKKYNEKTTLRPGWWLEVKHVYLQSDV